MIIISDHCIISMEAKASAFWPEECCGLLVGERFEDGRLHINEIVHCKNCAKQKTVEFLIDPSVHIALERQLRGTGREILGLFHSHPQGCPEPSGKDHESLADHDWVWIIVGINNRRTAEIKAYRRHGSEARLVPTNYAIFGRMKAA